MELKKKHQPHRKLREIKYLHSYRFQKTNKYQQYEKFNLHNPLTHKTQNGYKKSKLCTKFGYQATMEPIETRAPIGYYYKRHALY